MNGAGQNSSNAEKELNVPPTEIFNLLDRMRNTGKPDPLDALYDATDAALAARLGQKTRWLMQSPTADVKHTARLAASYAARVIDHLDHLRATKGRVH